MTMLLSIIIAPIVMIWIGWPLLKTSARLPSTVLLGLSGLLVVVLYAGLGNPGLPSSPFAVDAASLQSYRDILLHPKTGDAPI